MFGYLIHCVWVIDTTSDARALRASVLPLVKSFVGFDVAYDLSTTCSEALSDCPNSATSINHIVKSLHFSYLSGESPRVRSCFDPPLPFTVLQNSIEDDMAFNSFLKNAISEKLLMVDGCQAHVSTWLVNHRLQNHWHQRFIQLTEVRVQLPWGTSHGATTLPNVQSEQAHLLEGIWAQASY